MKISNQLIQKLLLCVSITSVQTLALSAFASELKSTEGLTSTSVRNLSSNFLALDPMPTPAPTPIPSPEPTPKSPPVSTPSVESADIVTNIIVTSTSTVEELNVPVTFGQVFAVGNLPAGTIVTGKLADGTIIPLQVNVKAKHQDGSVRHAIISAVVPSLKAGQKLQINLAKSSSVEETAVAPANFLSSTFSTRVIVTLEGVTYTASAEEALSGENFKQWLGGSTANEWLVTVPLKTAQGVAHPHLTARFAVRAYAKTQSTKVDVVLENNWAYEPLPQNFTYNVQIVVGGKTVYTKTALLHATHTRWKKTFWWGSTPKAYVKQNTAYIIGTRAVPNYDQSVVISESSLTALKSKFTGTTVEPMGSGLASSYMPSTGGRPDIGLLPSWAVSHLLTMDPRALTATLGMGDLAGSWGSHYRDKNTDQPVSLYDYPYMTILGRPTDTINPATKKKEAFPACGGVCSNKNTVDVAHQPNFAYFPYLITGDHYYLEELQFYAMFNSFNSNPGYRKNIQGLLAPEQLRGQGWGLRTIADAAYITPDEDRLKSHFMGIVDSNLNWYNTNYTNNPDANKLGIITNGYTIVYKSGTGTAPWQDDFFTQAVGHVAELGFEKAKPLLAWKAKFQIGRMAAPGFCWILGANYTLKVRELKDGPYYTSMEEVYQNSFTDPLRTLTCNSPEMAAELNLKVGEMEGYATSAEGFPSNYQPALAYAVDSGAVDGAKAWKIFISRPIKPTYQSGAQFNIIPRQ